MSLKSRFAGSSLFVCACAAVDCVAQTFAIDAHILSAGSSSQLASACFRLNATIAEPVAGFSENAEYYLVAGFRSVALGNGDDIFFSSFENCP